MARLTSTLLRLVFLALPIILAAGAPAFAICQLVADRSLERLPIVRVALAPDEIQIRYIGHSTFEIETPKGVRIATDYNGSVKPERLPRIATMNGAHGTHFTLNPEPGIEHVLLGWSPEGGPMDHDLIVDDVRVRNIQTNIRSWDGPTRRLGNSIFIFEVAELCIAHLGHLHQRLTEEDLTRLGKIDIVFVPVDGSATLAHESMIEVLKAIGPRIVIPMHAFTYGSLQAFTAKMAIESYKVQLSDTPTLIARRSNLPAEPTFLILPDS